jgi:hypothetical protein
MRRGERFLSFDFPIFPIFFFPSSISTALLLSIRHLFANLATPSAHPSGPTSGVKRQTPESPPHWTKNKSLSHLLLLLGRALALGAVASGLPVGVLLCLGARPLFRAGALLLGGLGHGRLAVLGLLLGHGEALAPGPGVRLREGEGEERLEERDFGKKRRRRATSDERRRRRRRRGLFLQRAIDFFSAPSLVLQAFLSPFLSGDGEKQERRCPGWRRVVSQGPGCEEKGSETKRRKVVREVSERKKKKKIKKK